MDKKMDRQGVKENNRGREERVKRKEKESLEGGGWMDL